MTFRKMVAALSIGTVGWIAASMVAMTYGMQLNWPDYVHVNFGFPLTYAIHTLDTIVGPADSWDVNLGAFAADMVFWFAGILAIMLAGLWYYKGRANEGPALRPMTGK